MTGVLSAASCLRADVLSFHIDPLQSLLTADAELVSSARVPLVPQDLPDATSVTTQYTGTIEVDVDDPFNPTTIQFLGADAVGLDSGAWLPAAGGGAPGDPGVPEPAQLGFYLDAGDLGTGYAAFRGISFSITSEPLIYFPTGFVSEQILTATRGGYDYNLISPLGNDAGTDDVTDEAAENFAIEYGTYEADGFTATLTVPVDARFGEGDDIEVVFIGELVASASLGQTLEGDYNSNGLVEQADLDLVLLHWGETATPPPGGWVNDLPSGVIDQDELDGVLLNWGNQPPPLAAADSIPEPYTFLLLLLAPTPLIARLRW